MVAVSDTDEAFARIEDISAFPGDEESGNVLGRTIEVEYYKITPDGSLRHPRFEQFRDSLTGDKG